MPARINGWHRGERLIHDRMKFTDPVVDTLHKYIEAELPEDHREFHSTRVQFFPISVLDELGRPWVSILAGPGGGPGFVSSPSNITLSLKARSWDGDPFLENVRPPGSRRKTLVAGIGLDYSTRKRTKFAGHVSRLEQNGMDLNLEFTITQAIQNCPKYIAIRDLVPRPDTSPLVVLRKPHMPPSERLPNDLVTFIQGSESLFLGTSYVAPSGDEQLHPSHVGLNHRGGRPGFVRVVPSDGRTIVIPDFSGDRIMTSLGNIEVTPLASLTFVSFTTGDILYITGDARTLIGRPSRDLMPLQNALTTVYVTGYIVVRNALPIRQRFNTITEPSPYSPPIRLLAEESVHSTLYEATEVSALLTGVKMHGSSLATFTWECSEEVHIKPGQAAIMDFTAMVGATIYRHVDPDDPTGLNDDRVRTWTVSTSHSSATRTFDLTMREKPGGVVTGALFDIARKLHLERFTRDPRSLGLKVRLMGISGDFILPAPAFGLDGSSATKLLWIAGGIGLTPFLSMLRGVTHPTGSSHWDIVMLFSTREPEVLLPLISEAFNNDSGGRVTLSLHVFSDVPIPDMGDCVALQRYKGRMPRNFFAGPLRAVDPTGRIIAICGPEAFDRAATDALSDVGVDHGRIRREGFKY